MELRRLGRSELVVPVIGLGTYRVFNVRDDAGERRANAVVSTALDAGCALMDSSPMYGEAERVLALSLAERRERAVVATKVWARTRAVGEQQIERALAWFERIELYQVHNLLAYADHLPFLQHLQQAGRIGAVGASHYLASAFPALIDGMAAGALAVVQVPYGPLQREAEQRLLPAAASHDVGVIVMSPLGGGALVRRSPAPDALAPLAAFGIRSWPQALLKWTLSDPRVHAVIPATAQPPHMAANAAAGGPPWLDDEHRDYVRTLAERLA